jgi:hypothetical protein
MKNVILIFMAIAFMWQQAEAQKSSRQYPGKVKYQKTEQDATIFDIPYPADQVEEGLKELAAQRGVKVKEKNGFYEARNLAMDKLGGKKHDVYYKVDKAGKGNSKVSMIIAEPGEDLANRTSSHAVLAGTAAGGAVILASIVPHLDEQDFNMLKLAQEEDIKKAEKKLAGLQDEQSKLQKKLSDINKEIDKNATDQRNATSELESKKSELAKFLEKREGGKKKN